MTTWTGFEASRRHVELLYGDPDAPVALRAIKKGLPTQTFEEPLRASWIESAHEVGYQVYIRPNRGGWKDAEIVSAPAYFVDGDDVPMPDPLDWHVTPSFVVSRSATRWQAWWCRHPRPKDLPDYIHSQAILGWRGVQLRLAERYGGDKMVATEATLMRLAGTLNLKDPANPVPYTLWEPV